MKKPLAKMEKEAERKIRKAKEPKVVFTYSFHIPGYISLDDADSFEEYAREAGSPKRENRRIDVEVECDDMWDAAMMWQQIKDYFYDYQIDLPERPEFKKQGKSDDTKMDGLTENGCHDL